KHTALNNIDKITKHILDFADFNRDGKLTIAEARSIWSLVQIDEFLYSKILGDKDYLPKITGSCGNLYSLEKIQQTRLPLTEDGGIVEFISDLWHHQDTNENYFMCTPYPKAFGYIKDYEAKVLKLNHLISSTSLSNRLPRYCAYDYDCSYDQYCKTRCNITHHQCSVRTLKYPNFVQLCDLTRQLIYKDANITFIQEFDLVYAQCMNLLLFNDDSYSTQVQFQIEQSLVIQRLQNLLWKHVQYNMHRITKKSTKKAPI
ncbi:unnamed protein product, partial [Didymodactylos carnosus]